MGQIIMTGLGQTMGAILPVFELSRADLDETWDYCRRSQPWRHEFVWEDLADTDRFGFGQALRVLTETTTPQGSLCFTTQPDLEREAMLSLEHLGVSQPHASKMPLEPFGLGIQVGRGGMGWCVWANLGDTFWETVDQDRLAARQALLESINAWHRSTGGERNFSILVHEGCHGLTIEIHHPQGGGLWLSGHRTTSLIESQFTDHNTDTYHQALVHLITLGHMRDTVRALSPAAQ